VPVPAALRGDPAVVGPLGGLALSNRKKKKKTSKIRKKKKKEIIRLVREEKRCVKEGVEKNKGGIRKLA